MKTLYLLRHAKSDWNAIGQADQDRPLSKRGKSDAPRMGRRFAQRDESLDQVIASPARRARDTAEMFCAETGFATEEIEIDSGLYFLGLGSIEASIRSPADGVDNLMLVFHNPDITGFVNQLDAGIRIDNVPTCGLIRIACAIDQWADWTATACTFEYFDYPKNDTGEPLTSQ